MYMALLESEKLICSSFSGLLYAPGVSSAPVFHDTSMHDNGGEGPHVRT